MDVKKFELSFYHMKALMAISTYTDTVLILYMYIMESLAQPQSSIIAFN